MVRRAFRASLRFAAVVLVVLVAVGAAMPAWARLVAGPPAHACRCEISGGHAHCACPLCFPELHEDETFGAPTLISKCGTDDPGWRTLSSPAVLASSFILTAPLARLAAPEPTPLAPPLWSEPPEPPPPRSRLSAPNAV